MQREREMPVMRNATNQKTESFDPICSCGVLAELYLGEAGVPRLAVERNACQCKGHQEDRKSSWAG